MIFGNDPKLEKHSKKLVEKVPFNQKNVILNVRVAKCFWNTPESLAWNGKIPKF